MSKISKILVSSLLLLLILSACAGSGSNPEQAVEAYLTAIVDADLDRITTLSCAEWEESAWLELD